MKEIKIRDLRQKEKFVVDDEYLNGYARLCGWNGTIVYMSLCRHADKDQFSFPSIKLMSEQHSVSTDSIKRGIKKLEEWGIVIVSKKERSNKGTWLCNGYTLTDKSQWKPKPDQGAHSHMAESVEPECSQPDSQSAHSTTKETHREGNTDKDSEASSATFTSLGADLLDLFSEINPACKKMFGNKTQRKAADDLIEEYGFDTIKKIVEKVLPYTNARPRYEYPYIDTPYQLFKNYSKLGAGLAQKKQELISKKNNVII